MATTNFNEILIVLFATAVGAFTLSLSNISLARYFYFFVILIIVIIVNIVAKKITARYLEAEIETKIWQFQRYGFHRRSYLKNPFPIGLFLPFLIAIISFGTLPWLALLQFEVSATPARASKRHGLYRFSELTDRHIAWIGLWGIVLNLILTIVAYLVNQPDLARVSAFYAFFNILPLGNLDGTKIFFGKRVIWAIFASICTIFLLYAIFLP